MRFLHTRIAQLQYELQRLQIVERRQDARGGVFVLCDLDGFKAAQDAHPDGHAYGDRVLSIFARFLQSITRSDADTVSVRFGGDEFIVWVPNIAAARAVEERVQSWRMGNITATAALGSDLKQADKRLMDRKRARKNTHA